MDDSIGAPKAFQVSECSDQLDPMRASCGIFAQHYRLWQNCGTHRPGRGQNYAAARQDSNLQSPPLYADAFSIGRGAIAVTGMHCYSQDMPLRDLPHRCWETELAKAWKVENLPEAAHSNLDSTHARLEPGLGGN